MKQSLFITIFFFFFSVLFFDFYLEQFEKPTSRYIYLSSLGDFESLLLTNDNFLLYPLYSKLYSLGSKYDLYGIFKVFMTFIFIFSLFYLLKHQVNSKRFFLIVPFVLLIIVPHVLILNSSALSIFISSLSILVLLSMKDKSSKFIFYFLVVFIGIFYRLEMAFIMLFLAFLFSVFFLKSSTFKFTFFALIFSISFLIFFQVLVSKNTNGLKDYYLYEKEIYNKNNTILVGLNPLDTNISTLNISYFAKALFLLDEKKLKGIEFKDIIQYKSKFDYFFKNKTFLNFVYHKFNSLIKFLFQDFKFLLIAIIFLFLSQISNDSFRKKIKSLLFLLILLIVPFAFAMFSDINNYFLNPYLSVILIGLMIIAAMNKRFSLKLYSFVFLMVIMHFNSFGFKKINDAKFKSYKAAKYINEFNSDKNNGIYSILNYIYFDEVLPSKLFKNYYKEFRIDFINYGPLTDIDLYTKRNQQLIGKEYSNLKARYQWLIENNEGIIYSDEFMKDFITLYLKKVHNFHVIFELQEGLDGFAIRKYKIRQVETQIDVK